MNKKNILAIITVALITLLAYSLRLTHYQQVPLPGQSLDEYSNAWVGMSLFKLGYPVGISGLAGYPSTDYRYINVDRFFQDNSDGNAMKINHPWLDHPPLMGMITGGYAMIKGANSFADTSVAIIRKPVIWLGVITVPLIYILTNLTFGGGAGLLAALIYAISPLMIVNSRMGQAENGLVPFWLLNLIFLILYKKRGNNRWLWLASFAAGVALLFKLTAIAVVITGVLLLLFGGKNKRFVRDDIILFLLISLSLGSLYFIFCLSLDAKTFLTTFVGNTSRRYGIGLAAVYDLIVTSKVTAAKYLTDGWALLGWLSLAYFSLSKKRLMKYAPIILPIFTYLAVFILFGSESFGWYRIPFFPFLFILIGGFLYKSLKKNIPLGAVALLIPLGINLAKIFPEKIPGNVLFLCRYGISFAILIVLTSLLSRKLALLGKIVILTIFTLTVLTSILYGNKLTVDYWYGAF